MSPNGLVVIPARNESGNLPRVLARLRNIFPEIPVVVVDDGSTDGTSEIAEQGGAVLLRHPVWLGYGAALQTGFKYALERNASWVVTMDADGQHDPADLLHLIRPVEENRADICVGSRFLQGPTYPMGWLKRAGVVFFRGLFRMLTGRRITDPTSGFRCLGRKAFRFCALDLFPHDYPDTDMMITMDKAGLRIVEAPVSMQARAGGFSMHARFSDQVYYVFKVSVSILATVFRESHSYLDELPKEFNSPTVKEGRWV